MLDSVRLAPVSHSLQVFGTDSAVQANHASLAAEAGHAFVVSDTWNTDDSGAPENVLMQYVYGSHATKRLVQIDDALLYYYLQNDGAVSCEATASTPESAANAVAYLRKILSERPDQPDRVSVKFWSLGEHGPEGNTRTIRAPLFEDIKGNYSAPVQKGIGAMVGEDFEPGKGGQLLLWHGPPGTGKTWALRAVSMAWKTWCSIEYVVDPEAFFGRANYLMKVLVGSFDTDKWRLIIFEDTGELLSSDARTRAGQGLSRLLNTVDGFIGQGLKVMALITTNEEAGKLHEAVSRPGRCAVNIGFDKMSIAEANAWMAANDVPGVTSGPRSLAELYALRDGGGVVEMQEKPATFGFRQKPA